MFLVHFLVFVVFTHFSFVSLYKNSFTKIPSEKIAPEAFENAIKCGCLLKQQIQGLKSENALPNVYMSRMHNQRSETKNLRWFMCIHYTCCPTVQKPISNYVYSDVVTSSVLMWWACTYMSLRLNLPQNWCMAKCQGSKTRPTSLALQRLAPRLMMSMS